MANTITLRAGQRQIKSYLIKPDKETEFREFANTNIRNWLGQNSVAHADFYFSRPTGLLVLTVALDQDDTDWDLIDGIHEFLQGTYPDFEEQPNLRIQ